MGRNSAFDRRSTLPARQDSPEFDRKQVPDHVKTAILRGMDDNRQLMEKLRADRAEKELRATQGTMQSFAT